MYGASGKNGNLCDGDSGGPTFASRNGVEVILGVHATKGGLCGEEGKDVRVDAFRDWILEEAGSDPVGVTPDLAAPSLRILNPVDGSTIGTSVVVTANATDDLAISKVKLFVDGKLHSMAEKGPFRFALKDLKSGSCEIRVVALDVADNETTATVLVNVDTSKPSTSSLSDVDVVDPDFGTECRINEDCVSGVCSLDSESGQLFCSRACTVELNDCPHLSTCLGSNNASACSLPGSDDGSEQFPPSGCNLAGDAVDTPVFFGVLLVLGMIIRRRRRVSP